VYLDWAQYPFVTQSQSGENFVVHLRDLRYDYPPLRGRGALSCTVTLDKNLNIIGEAFGQRKQLPPVP
jgi:hypothetical protein